MTSRVMNPYAQFWDIVGDTQLANGTLTFRENKQTTGLATIYTDGTFTTTQTNPYTLDAGGRVQGDVAFRGPLTMVVADQDGVELRTIDDVETLGGSSETSAIILNYDFVAAAVADPTLEVGDIVRTIAYYTGWQATSALPVGGASYEVVTTSITTPDDLVNHNTANGLVLRFVPDTEGLINVLQAGAGQSGSLDDINFLDAAFNSFDTVLIDYRADIQIRSKLQLASNKHLVLDGILRRDFVSSTTALDSYADAATIVNENAPTDTTWQSVDSYDWEQLATIDTNIRISGNGSILPTAARSAAVNGSSTLQAGPHIALLAVEDCSIHDSITLGGNTNSVACALWGNRILVHSLKVNLELTPESEMIKQAGVQILAGSDIVVGPTAMNTSGNTFVIGSNGNFLLDGVSVSGWAGASNLYAVSIIQNRSGSTTSRNPPSNNVQNISLSGFGGQAALRDKGVYEVDCTAVPGLIRNVTMGDMAVDMGLNANRVAGSGSPSVVTINGGTNITLQGACTQPLDNPVYDCSATTNVTLDFTLGELQKFTTNYFVNFSDNDNLRMDGSYDLNTGSTTFALQLDNGKYFINGRYDNVMADFFCETNPVTGAVEAHIDATVVRLTADVNITSTGAGGSGNAQFTYAQGDAFIYPGDVVIISGYTGDRSAYNGTRYVSLSTLLAGSSTFEIDLTAIASGSSTALFTHTPRQGAVVRNHSGIEGNVITVGGPNSNFNGSAGLVIETGVITDNDKITLLPSADASAVYQIISNAGNDTDTGPSGAMPTLLIKSAGDNADAILFQMSAPHGLRNSLVTIINANANPATDTLTLSESLAFEGFQFPGATTSFELGQALGIHSATFYFNGLSWCFVTGSGVTAP